MRGLRRRAIMLAVCGGLLAAACAPTSRAVSMAKLPDNAITFNVGYNRAFDRMVRALQEKGYEIAVADQRNGVIETRPRELPGKAGASGPFRYETYFSIVVRGGWNDAWAIVNLLVLPTYPEERERIIDEFRRQLR